MGGAELHLFKLIKSLDKDIFKPIVCTLREGGQLPSKIISEGIRLEQVPIQRIYMPSAIQPSLHLARILKEENVSIIHTFHFASDVLGTVLAKLAEVPVVISSRRDMGFKKKRHQILAYRFINLFVSKIIVNSEAVRNSVRSQERVASDKMVTIYNGVNHHYFNPAITNNDGLKQRLGLPPHCPVVGILANLHPIKAHSDFLIAAQLTLKEMDNVHFLIVGDGALKTELEKTASKLSIHHNVQFLGERSDIPELLSIMDVSVLCSISEGFSNSILESMSMGKPVVATRVGGNPEAIVHGLNGLLTRPSAPAELAEAILTLLSDRKLAVSLGGAARKTIEKNFSEERMVGETTSLYSRLLLEVGAIERAQITEKGFASSQQ
jgi:glycosyltransferase involved in cell wall biosynthesis